METPPPPYQANARLRLLSADQENREDHARLVAETTSMGNRFIHYRTEDALALMDNRIQLVGSFVDYNYEDMKGLFRDFKLSQQEEFMKMMSQIELGHDDVKAEVQLLREDGEQRRNEHQRELDMAEQRVNIAEQKVNMAEQRANDLVLILKTIGFGLMAWLVLKVVDWLFG
ncbi:hypothetical protein DL770_002797 [Monosporascus sp. CRB-9-2]|nr:hypothetical protein DL770_002797 [Monosporascus sp. CRB-9-2]